MRTRLALMTALLSLTLPAMAMETLDMGAKNHIAYTVYRKSDDAEHVHVRLSNRTDRDVLVAFTFVPQDEKTETGFSGSGLLLAHAESDLIGQTRFQSSVSKGFLRIESVEEGEIEQEVAVFINENGEARTSTQYLFTPTDGTIADSEARRIRVYSMLHDRVLHGD